MMIAFIFFIALTNYQIAKIFQKITLFFLPDFSYIWSISLPWLLVGLLLALSSYQASGLNIEPKLLKKNWLLLSLLSLLVILGLVLFYFLGITKYFHSVKTPFIFFIITPIAEELIFRGWIYGRLEKLKMNALIGSSLLFGLHHLQYFRYVPTPFAIFQMMYTFVLGLLFGKMRQKSGSIYLAILLHIFINWFTVSF